MNNKEYQISISRILRDKIFRYSKILNVSVKNLVSFLIANAYDELRPYSINKISALIDSALKNYKAEWNKADLSAMSYQTLSKKQKKEPLSKDKIHLQNKVLLRFRASEYIVDVMKEMALKLQLSESEVIIAMIYYELPIIGRMLEAYEDTKQIEDMKYKFQKDQQNFLKTVGISQPDFMRLSGAYVIIQMFENSNQKIRNRHEFGLE